MEKKIFKTLFVAVFASMLGIGIIAPLMPVYAESLGATGIWLGVVFSGFALSRLVLLPFIGRISDKKGRKKFILFGLFSYSLISLLYLTADSISSLIVVRFIHGFSSAFILPVAMAYVGETRDHGKEAISMGTFNISLFLGIGMGPILGGFLKDTFGMDYAFYAMAGLSLAAFFIVLFFLPDKVSRIKNPVLVPFKTIFKNDVVKALVFFRMSLAMGRSGIMVFLPLLASNVNITAFQIGVLFSINTFFNVSLQRFFGKLADKHNKFNFIIVGALVGGTALFFMSFADSFEKLIFTMALMGIGTAIAIPSATAVTVLLGRNMGMGTLMSSLDMAMTAGFVIAPLALGLIMDSLGMGAVFGTASLIAFIGAATFYYFIRKRAPNVP